MEETKIKIPVLLGPTATGKTELAVQLASEYGWEIISCDSRQIYRKMDIGTAKPTSEQFQKVKHWLIDIIDPSEPYSAYRFAEDSLRIIREKAFVSKTVLICGGTGMYFKILSEGMGVQVDSDPHIRDELMERGRVEGSASLHEELKIKDPESACKLHPNDLQRIVRALTVYYQAGDKISSLKKGCAPEGVEFEIVKLVDDRDRLYKRINDRVERMVRNGLLEEFQKLIDYGYDQLSPGMQCVGYKELFSVQRGECTLDTAIGTIQRNTRRYAKRQITWFTHQTGGENINSNDCYGKLKDCFKKKMNL